MRKVTKGQEPAVLANSKAAWAAAYAAKKTSYRRYRYRHPEIKAALVHETSDKCVYCESRIGHNTPGDVEHMVPSSVDPGRHFDWDNLTIACNECNRRKNDYFDAIKPFLNCYIDEVEDRLVHHGPVVGWAVGDQTAEISVRILELNQSTRRVLIAEKIERISDLNNKLERLREEVGTFLEPILRQEIIDMTDPKEKYSGMVRSILKNIGFLE